MKINEFVSTMFCSKKEAAKSMGVAYQALFVMLKRDIEIERMLNGHYVVLSERQKSFGSTTDFIMSNNGMSFTKFCNKFEDKRTAARYMGIDHRSLLNIFNGYRHYDFKIMPLENGKLLKVGKKTRVFRIRRKR